MAAVMKVSPRGAVEENPVKERCKVEDPGATEDTADSACC